jgi:hypoxanthine-DNA glycosylase
MSERHDMTVKSAFPPSVNAMTRVLILGSLLGERSLAVGEYYAHPSNTFWWLVGGVLDEHLSALPYAERLEQLNN